MVGVHRIRRQLVVAGLLSLCLGAAVSVPAPGGHFRSASMAWRTVSGNTVEFELQTAWRRSYEGFYVNGLPAMGEIYAGDVVSIGGSASPRFDFGDGGFAYIKVEVTDFSVTDDWIFGVTALNHSYDTPNRGYREDVDRYGDLHITQGSPWTAHFSGCCRLSSLQNMAGEAWNMSVALDTQQSAGFPSLRSLPAIAFPRTPDGEVSPLCKLLPPPSNTGVCTKVEFSTLGCGEHQSAMGEADGFVVVRGPETPAGFLLSAAGVARMPCSGGCPAPGLWALPGLVWDGRVAHVAVLNDGGGGACEGGELLVNGGNPLRPMAGTYSVLNGRIAGVVITSHGEGYQAVPAVTARFCLGAELEAVVLSAAWSVVVGVQERHVCSGPDALCDPSLPGVTYTGAPLPVIYPDSFPWIGYGWDPAALRVVPPAPGFEPAELVGGGAGGEQGSDGHAVLFAGSEWSARFEGELNWCQAPDGSVPARLRSDPACLVAGAQVTLGLSRLPAGAEVWAEQRDAITALLLTFDNPFQAHRPGHRAAVAREQRAFVDHPSAEQAVQLGFEQVPGNLNAGVGGAAVYLWVRRWDPARPPHDQRPITHLNVSASAGEEAALAGLGFTRLEGNLNEEAGGPAVHLWFKHAAANVRFFAQRPAADGLEVGIAELAVLPAGAAPPPLSPADTNPFLAGTQLPAAWEEVAGGGGESGDVNAGLGAGQRVWLRRGQANPWAQRLRWRPCACDVGRHYLCVAARSTGGVVGSTGERAGSAQRCLALHVLPDALPQFRAPAPEERIEVYMGREARREVAVAVLEPAKEVTLTADGLPPGAALDAPFLPPEGCDASGACYWRARELVWRAGWEQGGLEQRVCFHAADPLSGCEPPGQPAAASVCVVVAVARCVYALQAEQSLQEVAALFRTDWLNLYALNPALTTPDRLLTLGQLLNVGHLYTVAAGDTAANIVKRFGTTVGMVLALNADVRAAELLLVGQTLCLLPDHCTPAHPSP